jgi:hypothetical protein
MDWYEKSLEVVNRERNRVAERKMAKIQEA